MKRGWPILVGFLLLLWLPPAQANDNLPDVLTLEEAAELLRTDTKTVELMAEAWTIPGQRLIVGASLGPWRFSREALMAWLERREARSVSSLSPDLETSTRQFEAAAQHVRSGDNYPPEPEAQSAGVIGSAPEGYSASQMFLRDQSVLLKRNELSFDVGLFYVRQDSQLVLNGPTTSLATIENRSANILGVLRYSFVDETEVFLRATGTTTAAKIYASGEKLGSTSHSSQGDIDIGLRHVLVQEGLGKPEIILGLEGQLRTGEASEALTGSVTLLKSLDPAVLFGTLSHQYANSREFREIALLEPERTTTLNLGYAFALNDTLSLNVSAFTTHQERTQFANATLRENDFSALQLGVTAKVARGIYLQPRVSFGLTGVGSTFSLGLNIPMYFGQRNNTSE